MRNIKSSYITVFPCHEKKQRCVVTYKSPMYIFTKFILYWKHVRNDGKSNLPYCETFSTYSNIPCDPEGSSGSKIKDLSCSMDSSQEHFDLGCVQLATFRIKYERSLFLRVSLSHANQTV